MIDELTVESVDNGIEFTNPKRKNIIIGKLRKSENYVRFGEKPLSLVYRHKDFNHDLPFSLISCHIDSIYDNYFSHTPKEGDGIGGAGHRAWVSLGNGGILTEAKRIVPHELDDDNKQYHVISGTYDNSVCNAILLDCLLMGGFPPQVLISFTGDEENESIGVDQTIKILEDTGLKENLQFVCVLDITEECYERYPLTIENIFRNKKELISKRFPQALFEDGGINKTFPIIEEGDPDESWQYDEHHCNCFSFCLPCKVLGDDMHSDEGVSIKLDALFLYQRYIKVWFKLQNKAG